MPPNLVLLKASSVYSTTAAIKKRIYHFSFITGVAWLKGLHCITFVKMCVLQSKFIYVIFKKVESMYKGHIVDIQNQYLLHSHTKPLIIISLHIFSPTFPNIRHSLIVFSAQLKHPDRGNMQLSRTSKESLCCHLIRGSPGKSEQYKGLIVHVEYRPTIQ